MKEYTLAASVAAILAVFLDHVSGTRLLRRPRFIVFLSIILCFKLWVNGFLTAAPVVLYNPEFFLGARVGTIPVEDFLFGFAMVMLAVIVWEKEKMRAEGRRGKREERREKREERGGAL